MPVVKISLFPDLTSKVPTPLVFDNFAEFVEAFGPHEILQVRDGNLGLFSPVSYKEGTTRGKANVAEITVGVLDFDDVPTEHFEKVALDLADNGTEFLVYTTWSHAEAVALCKVRARIIVPFTRAVDAKDWPAVWSSMYQLTGRIADPQCSDASRMYYIPGCRPKDKESALYYHSPGAPLDVDKFSGLVVPRAALALAPMRYDDIGVADLQRLVTTLSRGRTPYKLWLQEKVKLLLAGDSLADVGARDKTTWDMVCGILDHFPRADPKQLIKLFAPSLQSMELEAPGAPTSANLLEKVTRQQAQVAEKKALEVQAASSDRTRHIALAFGLTGRDTGYTQGELNGFAKMLGLNSLEHLQNHWIIQRVDSYYILVDGAYKGPFTWSELDRAAQVYLAPAHTAGVETHEVTPRGTVEPKSGRDMMQQYGTVASRTHISLYASKSSYEVATGTITEAPTPLRFTEPLYDATIDEWLQLLGGETKHKLFDWLSVVTRIEEPCAALYLEGAKGVGKSLLAEGIASLWSVRGPTTLVDAMSSFNESIMECPLLFADESIPSDFRGKARTGEIRQMIQARTRPLKRKFLPGATVWGCCRLILAANNADLINSSEHLTVNDIEAIVDRFVHVDANQAVEARKFLERQSKQTLVYWAKEGIARFCIWLSQNHQFDDKHRFLVQGDRTTLHRRLTVSSGIRSAVCCWLVGYLLDPRHVDVTGNLLVRIHKGRLLVNVRAIQSGWTLYDTSEKPPTVADLAKAIKGISDPDTTQLTDGKGNRTHYHVVDTGNLVSWAEEFGYTTKEAIEKALKTDTPKVRGTK